MATRNTGNMFHSDSLADLQGLGSNDGVSSRSIGWSVAESSWFYPTTINANTSSWGVAGSPVAAGWENIYEFDFEGAGAQTINSGANVIDGKTWTTLNFASTSIFEIDPGVGLTLTNDATGDWVAGLATGPGIFIPITSLDSDARADDEYRIKFWYAWTPGGTGGRNAVLGGRSDGGSGLNNFYAGSGTASGGTATNATYSRVTADSNTDSYTKSDAALMTNYRVIYTDILNSASNIVFYAGTAYSGGWPSTANMVRLGGSVWANDLNTVTRGGWLISNLQILIAIRDTAGTGSVLTVRRIALDKRRIPQT